MARRPVRLKVSVGVESEIAVQCIVEPAPADCLVRDCLKRSSLAVLRLDEDRFPRALWPVRQSRQAVALRAAVQYRTGIHEDAVRRPEMKVPAFARACLRCPIEVLCSHRGQVPMAVSAGHQCPTRAQKTTDNRGE